MHAEPVTTARHEVEHVVADLIDGCQQVWHKVQVLVQPYYAVRILNSWAACVSPVQPMLEESNRPLQSLTSRVEGSASAAAATGPEAEV